MQAYGAVAHVALDFLLRRKCRHGVNDNDVDGRGADELVGYFECLLAIIGLGDVQIVHIDTQLRGIEAVEGMLSVDEGCNAASFLALGNGMDGQCSLTAGLGTKYLDDTAARITAHA